MRNFLQRAAGPGIVALVGLGFDAADFFGSSALAYVAWTAAGLWAVYLAWPRIKRWRPLTLAPADGEGRAVTTDPFLAKLRDRNEQLEQLNKNLEAERNQLSEVLQDTKHENAKLKEERDELQKLLAANRPPQNFKTPVETINVLTPAEVQEIEGLKAENERLRTDATSPEVAKQKRRCFHLADQLRSLYEELLDGERLLIAHFQERQEANVPEKELEEERRAKQLELEGRIRHTYSYGYFDRFEKLYEELEPDGWLGPNDEDLFLNLRDAHDIKKVADRLDDVGRHLL